MKTIILSTAVLLISVFSQAQTLKIDRSDIGYPGQSYSYYADSAYSLPPDFMSTGINKRWEFSDAAIHDEYVVNFLEPNEENGGHALEGCNLVIQEDHREQEFTPCIVTNGEKKVARVISTELGNEQGFQPRMLVFPMMYGTQWNDTFRAEMISPGEFPGIDSIKVEVLMYIDNLVDAEGTLLTPTDSAQALRIRTTVDYEYSFGMYVDGMGWIPGESESGNAVVYGFYSHQGGHYAAYLDQIGEDIFELSYRKENLASTKKPHSSKAFNKIFPNPANAGYIMIQSETGGLMNVMDIQGKLVRSAVSLEEGLNRIDIQGLESGHYFISIQHQDGTVQTEKLVVN